MGGAQIPLDGAEGEPAVFPQGRHQAEQVDAQPLLPQRHTRQVRWRRPALLTYWADPGDIDVLGNLRRNRRQVDDFSGALGPAPRQLGPAAGTIIHHVLCYCSAIPSSLTVKRKCPHHGECDIDAERADEASGSQQFDGGPYDLRAGSDIDGSERAPHQALFWRLTEGTAQPHSLTAIEVADQPTLHRTRWRPTWCFWRGPDTRESTTRT